MKIICMPVGPLMTNCYLLCDEEKGACAVIDPGGEGARVARAVEEAGCALECVLLTHGHYDHTGGVAELLARFPETPVYLNHRDQYPPEDRQMNELYPPLPQARDYGEGDGIKVGDLTVQVLSTPGHTKGGVTLLCRQEMFCGDTLFAGSMGRTDLAGGDEEEIFASLKRLGQLEGDYTVHPGHMNSSRLSRERQYNPYLVHALRF